MSRPHDGHQNFFPFGNPFRMIFPKGSNLSPKLLGLLKSFEETLADRLKKLKLENKVDIVSLSWMKLAMELLSETHTDIKTLVTELQFPVSDWDEKWMDVYLDGSVKLLDVCIAFSSQLSQIKQSQLLLQCVIHGLDNSGAFPSREQLLRAWSSLDEWMKQVNLRNPKLENCSSILHAFTESLHLAKVKNSAKGKVLMHAMYGVKVVTMFVCSVFAAAFSGSAKALEFNVSDKFLWEEAFNDLQADVNGVMRSLFSNGSLTVLKEMEAVEVRVKKLYSMIGDGAGPVDAETLQNSVSDLKKSAERLSQGLDLLSREIEGFFQIVLTGRDALLCNLRVFSSESDRKLENYIKE